MIVYIFRCSTNPNRYGFTGDKTGSNLPKNKCDGNWLFLKDKNWNKGDTAIGVEVDAVVDAIAGDGTYVSEAIVEVG